MSIGLISENKIREALRKEIESDIKKFLDNGGQINNCDSDKKQEALCSTKTSKHT